jgi:hypothetical protein
VLLWNTDFTASRVSTRALAIEAGRILPVDVAGDRNWIGTIRGIALVLRGSFAQPILVRGATAKPATPRQVLGDRVREWLAFEPWNGTSINTVIGGADAQELRFLRSLPRSCSSPDCCTSPSPVGLRSRRRVSADGGRRHRRAGLARSRCALAVEI